jgi:hypothetical protein
MKLNTKPLKFKCRLADGGGGGAGWSTHARHGYPHLVKNKSTTIILKIYLGKKTEHNFFRFTIIKVPQIKIYI